MLVKPRYHYVALLYNDQSILFSENHGPAKINREHTRQFGEKWYCDKVKTKPTFMSTVLCKSNANDNRRISLFVLAIYRRYISETSHGLVNAKTINQQDIGTTFAISRQDIALSETSSPRYLTKQNDISP